MKLLFFTVLVFVDEYIVHPIWELITPKDLSPRPWDVPLTDFCLWVHENYHKIVSTETARIHR